MRLFLITLLLISSTILNAQDAGFAFGKPSVADLTMKVYPADTSARAVILDEFGETYFENGDGFDMIHEFHVKIKILKDEGKDKGNFEIGLYKNKDAAVKLLSWEASTFNVDGGFIKESKVDKKGFFLEKYSDNYEIAKFTFPNVRVGSVIEIKYKIESPFIRNLYQWTFQDDIPKVRSEYWVHIPGVYVYNIALNGYLKLTKDVSEIARDCFFVSTNFRADCAFNKYAMEKIPAFSEEEYMTARQNYISSIEFELVEQTTPQGNIKRYTSTWKDVDNELRSSDRFGKQIKKASGIKDENLKALIGGETDPLKKATIIYNYLNKYFVWNAEKRYGSNDVKKAYEARKGSSGDINLALVGALQGYDIDADPVMLSTRDNGLVTELYPVVTDFNYVIARVKIGQAIYFLDATDAFLPFGSLPLRCVNGKGRLISKTESDWVVLRAGEKQKRTVTYDLKLTREGNFKGRVAIQSTGYYARDARKELQNQGDINSYLKYLEKGTSATYTNYTVENRDDLTKPLVEKFEIERPGFEDVQAPILYFNPFFSRYSINPLKSKERLYPVDMGIADEQTMTLILELPESVEVDERPKDTALQLPQNGGRFLLSSSTVGNKITLTNVISFNKSVYTSVEYHSLREFFERIVQVQQGQFVFKKK
ncbi:hypothetical protein BH09BAC3_BH09BAC3_15410 [soil metagenome]